MRALQLTDFGRIELLDVPEPVAGDHEVVVEVVAAGICGSDLHGVNGGFLREPPVIMGHEFSALTPRGEPVAINPQITCGHCAACDAGREHLCPERRFIGIHRAGGFAERVAVPSRCLVALPAGVYPEAGALVEPLAVALHAWNLAEARDGMRVGVLGGGTIGLSVLICARAAAVDVQLAEPRAERRAYAEALGTASITDELNGPFDVIIDAVGSPETHRRSLEELRRGGNAVWVGNSSPCAGFDAQELVRREHRVQGSTAYTHQEFVDAAGRVGDLPAAWVEQHPLEAGEDVFARLLADPSRALKVCLVPGRATPTTKGTRS